MSLDNAQPHVQEVIFHQPGGLQSSSPAVPFKPVKVPIWCISVTNCLGMELPLTSAQLDLWTAAEAETRPPSPLATSSSSSLGKRSHSS